MKKILIVLCFLFTGCVNEEMQQKSINNINAKLPNGCELHYIGDVTLMRQQYPVSIFLTKCKNGDSFTLTEIEPIHRLKNIYDQKQNVIIEIGNSNEDI